MKKEKVSSNRNKRLRFLWDADIVSLRHTKGGPGSGHWGHSGRPGKRGGSAPGTTGARSALNGHALAPFNILAGDLETYNRVMKMNSPEAKEMLSREGFTRAQARDEIDSARRRQISAPHTRDKHQTDGEYTSERKALHDRIVAETLEGKSSVPEGEQPTIIFTGGYPGAGKSSMLSNPEYADRINDYVHVDSDGFKGQLGKADGIEKLGWRAQSYHLESDDIIAGVFDGAIKNRQNIVFDGTMKSAGKVLRLAQEMRKKGYRVEIAFADLPMEKAMTRAIGRFLGGGRFVDPAYIASHDHKNIITLGEMKDVADVWRHWNTDVPFGQQATLVGEGGI